MSILLHLFSFPSRYLRFWIQFSFNAGQSPVVGSGKQSEHDYFAKDLAGSFRLPPADNILAKRKTGLHSKTRWYNREHDTGHNGKIGVPWVLFVLLTPPVGYIRQPECTPNLYWVGVVIIDILITLCPVVQCLSQRMYIEPGGSQ